MKYVVFRRVQFGAPSELLVFFDAGIPSEAIRDISLRRNMVVVSAGIVEISANGCSVSPNPDLQILPRAEDTRLFENRLKLAERKVITRTIYDLAADMIVDGAEFNWVIESVRKLLRDDHRESLKSTLATGTRGTGEIYTRLVLQYTGDDTNEEAKIIQAGARTIVETVAEKWRERAAVQRKAEAEAKAKAAEKVKPNGKPEPKPQEAT